MTLHCSRRTHFVTARNRSTETLTNTNTYKDRKIQIHIQIEKIQTHLQIEKYKDKYNDSLCDCQETLDRDRDDNEDGTTEAQPVVDQLNIV